MNAFAFVLSSMIVFALAVHPGTADIGLVFFLWLAPVGTLALILEERALTVAAKVKAGVQVSEIFGRTGRKRLRDDPDRFFARDDYEDYRGRNRAISRLAFVAIGALIVATVAVSIDDVLEVRAAIEQAEQPWWFQN